MSRCRCRGMIMCRSRSIHLKVGTVAVTRKGVAAGVEAGAGAGAGAGASTCKETESKWRVERE